MLYPANNILNGWTIFFNIEKGIRHVGKSLIILCKFILKSDCASTSVGGSSRWTVLLRWVERYSSIVVLDLIFAKIAAIVVVFEKSNRFSSRNNNNIN